MRASKNVGGRPRKPESLKVIYLRESVRDLWRSWKSLCGCIKLSDRDICWLYNFTCEWNLEIQTSCYSALKPMFTLSGKGCWFQIILTAHEGITLLLPLPKYPCSHKINCLYPAFRKLAIEKSRGSTLRSHQARIANSTTWRSMHRLWKSSYEVMHSLLWQHLFSFGVGMSMQFPQIHQLFQTLSCSGCGSSLSRSLRA